MKIVINTNYNSAGTRVCVDDMTPRLKVAGHEVTRNDWEDYQKYDLALFMAPDSAVDKAKEQNPNITVGIMDPKLALSRTRAEAERADFLLVSSIEQRDVFWHHNKNVFIYFMFPETMVQNKIHKDKEKIILGYHGNKLHLHCFNQQITPALDSLGAKYDLELRVLYNVKKLGQWKIGLPKTVKITHLQWSEEAYYKEFAECDVGLVNNYLPINNKFGKFASSLFKKLNRFNPFGFNQDDYLVRYKYSTNPGRIYIFSQLGIPVVADTSPSMCQLIQDGRSGFLVNSTEGWQYALEKLIKSAVLRQQMSKNLFTFIEANYSIEKNFVKFNDYIINIVNEKNYV